MSNVIPFRRRPSRFVYVQSYEGREGDRFLVVLVESDGTWAPWSAYLEDPAKAAALGEFLAEAFDIRFDPQIICVGTWSAGGAR
ncbi:hypothetical protein [Ancylobacter terrae]|uniref:hypothetical protein n=1 Tax=Ancylobacter sp. sgz301288 TaxID=3342077 RepID=UPI0038595B39